MTSTKKTKAQLLEEVEALRARVQSLEAGSDQTRDARYFQQIIKEAPVAIGLVRDGVLLYANNNYLHMFGYDDISDVSGKPLANFIVPYYRKEVTERHKKHELGEDASKDYEALALRKDGSEFPFRAQISFIEMPDGAATAGFFTDITERKQVEDTLRRERNRAQRYLDLAGIMFVGIDSQQTVSLINRKGCEILGYLSYEIVGKNWFEAFIPARIREEVQAVFNRLVAGEIEPVEYFENPILTHDGTERIIAWHNALLHDIDGNITGTLSAGEDITEQKMAAEELHRRNAELTTLNQIGQALNQLIEPAEMLELIFEMTGQVLDNQNLYIALRDEAKQQVCFPIYMIKGKRQTIALQTGGKGLTEYILRTQKPLLIPADFEQTIEQMGIASIEVSARCFLGVPMMAGDKAIGVLAVQDYDSEGVYQDSHVMLLMTIASQAASALENARLYQQAQQEIAERKRTEEVLQRRAAQLAILNSVSEQIVSVLDLEAVLERSARLIHEDFGYHHVAIFINNQVQGKTVMKTIAGSYVNLFPPEHSLKLGQGMVGWVAGQGKRLLANDVRNEPRYVNLCSGLILTRSELSIPIRIGQEIVGVLDVQSPRIDAFDGNDVMVIETLAGQIAAAIENARLYGAAQLDLAERRQAEEALLHEKNLSDTIIDSLPGIFYMYDRQGRLVKWNRRYKEVLGYSDDDLLNTHFVAFCAPEDAARVSHVLGEAFTAGTVDVEATLVTKTGGRVFYYLTGRRLQIGDHAYLVGVGTDITRLKQIEKALHREHSLLERIMQTSPVFIVTLDRDGHIIYANPQAERILHVANKQIIGLTYSTPEWHITNEHGLRISDAQTVFQKVITTGQAVYNERRDAEIAGKPIHCSINAAPFHDSTGQIEGVVTIVSDITPIVQAERSLQQYVKRLKTLHELDQSILLAETSQAVAEAALDRLKDLIPCKRICVVLFDFDRDEVEILASYARGETDIVKGLKMTPKEYGVDETLLKGHVLIIEDLNARTNLSKTQKVICNEGVRSIVAVPLMVQSEPIGTLSLGADEHSVFGAEHIEIAQEVASQLAIAVQHARLRERDQRHTEELEQRVAERTAELRMAYEQLQMLSRIKDEFVSNVSHELRTPISSIKTYLHLFPKRPDKQERYTETLKREINRLEYLIEGLLTLSRFDQKRVHANFTTVDLNNLINEYITDRSHLAVDKGLELSTSLLEEIPGVTGDRQMLGEVLSILLTNALSYTPAGGQITVSTHTRQAEDGVWVGFSVRDNGWGILAEEQGHLFERFHRGRAARETKTSGTGLGLAIAKEIVQLHRGHIEIVSDGVLGHGTEFSVWLPNEG
ncbi:MAG: PAS domain S-box protein [Anaerolineae bacterium]|nr:PAS domain S-box protein [Anaerolineae bacterium]